MEIDFYNLDYINLNGNFIHKTAIISDNVKLGRGNIIYPNVVIGEGGFFKGEESAKGKIIIGNNNRIGINVTIMSGNEGDTVIGDDNKIMNGVNIGHNSIIGNKTILSAGTIIPGYVTIEDYVNIGLNSTINNRLTMKEGCMIGHGSVITSNTKYWAIYKGNPARESGFNKIGAERSGLKDCKQKWEND